jgi:hypothetical protein
MKLLISTVSALAVALIIAPAAFAGPFGLPDHEKNGWRDTGCDEAENVAVTNDKGDLLYLNNPTCPVLRSLKTVTFAGPDGILGTADDVTSQVSDN